MRAQRVAGPAVRPAARASGKTLIARVNPLGSEHFDADVRAVVRPGLALLNLPKVEATEDVLAAAAGARSGRARERRHASRSACCSTSRRARGLRLAYTLASAHPRVAGLQLGLGDLFEPLADRPPRAGRAARRDAADAPGRRRGRRIRLRRRVRPLRRTSRASAPRPASRGAWATSARAASTRARWRTPTRCSAPPTTRSRMRAAWSPPPTRPMRAASAPTPSTARWSTRRSCSARGPCSPPPGGSGSA